MLQELVDEVIRHFDVVTFGMSDRDKFRVATLVYATLVERENQTAVDEVEAAMQDRGLFRKGE